MINLSKGLLGLITVFILISCSGYDLSRRKGAKFGRIQTEYIKKQTSPDSVSIQIELYRFEDQQPIEIKNTTGFSLKKFPDLHPAKHIYRSVVNIREIPFLIVVQEPGKNRRLIDVDRQKTKKKDVIYKVYLVPEKDDIKI